MNRESPQSSSGRACQLPPDVRDRAAQAAWERANGTDGPFGWADLAEDEQAAWKAGVDAVAEVLADHWAPSAFAFLGLTDVEVERDALKSQLGQELAHQRQAAIDYSNTIGPMVRERDALKARVAELEAALAARATEFQRALKADVAARLRLSDDVEALSDENLRLREQADNMAEEWDGPAFTVERDALLGRIVELKRQLDLALRGQGAIDYSKVIDPMVSENVALKARVDGLQAMNGVLELQVKRQQARVDLLTTALTGLVEKWDAEIQTYPTNDLGSMARASVRCCAREVRAVLSANPTESEA